MDPLPTYGPPPNLPHPYYTNGGGVTDRGGEAGQAKLDSLNNNHKNRVACNLVV